MNIKLGPPKTTDLKPRITVIGVGGAGCNAINNMIATQLDGVEFIVANTDAQSLNMSNAERRIQLGTNLTEGLGAGAKPEVGEAAAREAEEDIRAEISGSHMVFVAAGMGGGTGTGAATVIAEIARDLGILTVAIVSKPFQFEGARRMRTAEAGIAALEQVVDTLIVIPNQNLFRIANERTTFAEAFRLADQVLYSGIACIVDLIVKEGLINLDFADVQAVMKGMGTAMMGTGEASGEDRALTAANEAIANPLLDNVTLSGAQGLLISIVGGSDLTLYEVDTAASHIRKEVAADANIIVGATTEEGMNDRLRVSIVASGLAVAAGAAHVGDQARGSAANQSGKPPAPAQVAAPPLLSPLAKNRADATKAVVPAAPAKAASAPKSAAPREVPSYPDAAMEADEDAAYQPPAMPARSEEMDASEADAFAQALSEAMQGASAADDEDYTDGETWRSADGIVIEEGFSDGRRPVEPPPLPQRTPAARIAQQNTFEPAVPAEVRRGTPRIPEVSEFPEVAQREYFAKMQADQRASRAGMQNDGHAEGAAEPKRPIHNQRARGATQATEASQPAPQEPAPLSRERPGLLRRLTGGVRK